VPEDSLAPYRGRFPERPFVNPNPDAAPAYRSQAAPNAATAAMIARLDRDVGRLLALLGELGIDRDTAVLFTSDNGPHAEGGRDPAFFASAGPLRGIKRDLYEGGIRVPMIVRWPGTVRAGTVSDHVWAGWDLLPTVAAMAGAAPPAGLDGVSVLPVLRGRRQRPSDHLYWEFHRGGRLHQAVRHGNWKAVRQTRGGPLELYDLAREPGESADVAARHPALVARIERYLRGARTDSPDFPVKE